MAQLVTAFAFDPTRVPSLQFNQIQAGGVAFVRWTARHVCAAAGSLHVLLAAILLVCLAGRGCLMIPSTACSNREQLMSIGGTKAECNLHRLRHRTIFCSASQRASRKHPGAIQKAGGRSRLLSSREPRCRRSAARGQSVQWAVLPQCALPTATVRA